MAEEDQDGPDLETLQAQIDMSMAFTHNIVSGWMKSSKASLPSSSRNEDKELEEYMRRPPRLGVGASVPEATGVLSRETAKLRTKLTRQGKKREREDEVEPPARTAGARAAPGGLASDSDDEEDSRARVITKKARIDPFASKGGEGTRKKKVDSLSVPTGQTKAMPGAPPTADEKHAKLQSSHKSAREEKAPEGEAGSSAPSGKKKKKKKRKAGQAAQPDCTPSTDSIVRDGVGALAISEKNISNNVRPTDPSSKSPVTSQEAPPKTVDSSANPALASTSAVPASNDYPLLMASKVSPTMRQDPFGHPLLNLSGPPPSTGEELSGPLKKKRKRKKKKKAVAQLGADADAVKGGDDHTSDDE
ncbi:hypothetical protein BD414DRAFT_474409 [Trametes punicea]|nr:hypothetical protein BD414DRAFT_474409 [Trametes punicea]